MHSWPDQAMLSVLAGRLDISNANAQAVLDALPETLPPQRRAVVEAACQLVGKVNYFWGGKSTAIGWDDRWGTMQKVTVAGSTTSGAYRPIGWIARNFWIGACATLVCPTMATGILVSI